MQRMSRLSRDAEKTHKEDEIPVPSTEDQSGAISHIQSSAPLNSLYTSEAYISRLEDTAYELQGSTHQFGGCIM